MGMIPLSASVRKRSITRFCKNDEFASQRKHGKIIVGVGNDD